MCSPGAGPGSKVQVLVPAVPAAPSQTPTPYIAARAFQGNKPGYIFAARDGHTGYYLDTKHKQQNTTRQSPATSTEEFVMIESPAWNCASCTTVNNGTALDCSVCRKQKNSEAQGSGSGSSGAGSKNGGSNSTSGSKSSGSKTTSSSSTTNSNQKKCQECTYVNPSNASKCNMCGCVLHEQKHSSWVCCSCTYENTASSSDCSMCGQPQIASGTIVSGGGGGSSDGGGTKTDGRSVFQLANSTTSTSNDPVDQAFAAIQNGIKDGDIRKMLKEKCHLSTGKAQKALREAKNKQKHSTHNNVAESKVQSLRVPSTSIHCGMCNEEIQRGSNRSNRKKKTSTSATCLCEHYYCFDCLGLYVESKIIAGEVQEDQIDCPDSFCTCSMLQDPMGEFTPNYLFTRHDGFAQGILGNAFPYQKACDLNTKFLNHRNRKADLFITCPNPLCEIKVYVEENVQFFRCEQQYHGCGQSFCKKCKEPAHHGILDCKQAKASHKADAALDAMSAQVIAEGGRFCPSCSRLFAAEDVDPDKWPCDHITCPCGYQFCRNCGANRKLVVQHDNSWHVSKCGLWGTYEGCPENAAKPQDWPRVWKEKDPQFNYQGESFFDACGGVHKQVYKEQWKKLGTLKTKKHPTQGYFRKCQKHCGCSYGSGHSKFQLSKK